MNPRNQERTTQKEPVVDTMATRPGITWKKDTENRAFTVGLNEFSNIKC